MKEVIAIIRLNKTKETKSALAALGLPSFTAMRAAGRGSRLIPGNTHDAKSVSAYSTSQGPRLFPKRLLSFVVPDDMVGSVVKAIIRVDQTGAPRGWQNLCPAGGRGLAPPNPGTGTRGPSLIWFAAGLSGTPVLPHHFPQDKLSFCLDREVLTGKIKKRVILKRNGDSP